MKGQWIIWYGDGTTYDSGSDLYAAPTLNVQVISCWDQNGDRSLIHTRDFYWWVPDHPAVPEYWDEGWFGGDGTGLAQYMFSPGFPKYVIYATSIETKQFQRILDAAVKRVTF